MSETSTENAAVAKFALIIVCLGSIIGPLGMASVNIAIPDLAADLQANAKMVSWLPTLFILSSVIFMLPASKLADNYGRKRIYAYGLALNAFSSLMGAVLAICTRCCVGDDFWSGCGDYYISYAFP